MIAADMRRISTLAGVLAIALAIGIAIEPAVVVLGVVGIALVGWYYREIHGLKIWQHLLQLCLLGLITLNYGFANYALFGIPVAHVLAASALIFALYANAHSVIAWRRESAIIALMVLLALSLAHLSVDLLSYGVLALRDASFVFESSLLYAGYLWALDSQRRAHFFRMLAFIFIFNFAYTLTFPIKDMILAYSPTSGVFREVPLLGFYIGTPLFLVAGGFYFLVADRWLPHWPRLLLVSLAVAQLGWSLIIQDRAMYLGLLFLPLVAIAAGRWTVALKVGAFAVVSAILIFGIISTFGLQVSGRLSSAGAGFFLEHVQSLLMKGESPGIDSNYWRINILHNVLARWQSSIGNILFGEGFGLPLIDFRLAAGNEVRQPHNTHLSVLARLGVVGLMAWFWFIAAILARVITTVRAVRESRPVARAQLLVLLVFLVLGLFYTTVQPWLEFSYGAIPFFVIAGFALGYARVVCEDSRPDGVPRAQGL